ncbi:MAG TPA: polysaccharide deacetylase family protein [Gaiellaceae bacterium]|nr:polysaccharide deacetylase family protein [Gaiellaceae bacterium]
MRKWPFALGAAAGATGWALYNGLYPTAQGFGKAFVGTPGTGRLMALTFDDGPNTAWTPRLLEVLDRFGVKATFFSIGHYAREQPDLLREVAAAGHAIGNHTYTHVTMPLHTDETIRRELRQTTEAIEEAGVEMARAHGRRLMRPPYGRRRPGTLRVLREEGYIPILWSVTLWDWSKGVTTEKIMRKAEKQIRGGDIVLLHDGCDVAMGWDRSHSVRSAELILTQWKEQEGFEFVTIPELIERTGFQPA